MRKLSKYFLLFVIGGTLYTIIEILWRGRTHPAMFAVGGICFLLLGGINEMIPWETPLLLQGVIGAGLVTGVELIAGMILNLWLGLGIWDYSNMPMNVMGQICLPFSGVWFLLSLVGIILDDWLRYWMWGEEYPHYRLI